MSRFRVIVAALSLLLLASVSAVGQTPPESDVKLKLIVDKLMRENQRLEVALQSCSEERDAAREELARVEKAGAVVAQPLPAAPPAAPPGAPAQLAVGAHAHLAAAQAVPPPAQPAGSGAPRNTPPPDRNAQYFADGTGKADEAVSPIPFPQVPQRTDWFDQHLARQFDVLKHLYTPGALQGLPQDEAQCNDARTRQYCQMAVRLYWISSAR